MADGKAAFPKLRARLILQSLWVAHDLRRCVGVDRRGRHWVVGCRDERAVVERPIARLNKHSPRLAGEYRQGRVSDSRRDRVKILHHALEAQWEQLLSIKKSRECLGKVKGVWGGLCSVDSLPNTVSLAGLGPASEGNLHRRAHGTSSPRTELVVESSRSQHAAMTRL